MKRLKPWIQLSTAESSSRRESLSQPFLRSAWPMAYRGPVEGPVGQRLPNHPAPRTRQVHLDFHTSEFIPGVGEKFDKQQWQDALRAGHVNHINIFAKCHHSWSYYPTRIGNAHPSLKFDLLGAEIAACHEIGVNCPIYYTVGWSAHDAEVHPEWCVRDKNGDIVANGGLNPTRSRPTPSLHSVGSACALPPADLTIAIFSGR